MAWPAASQSKESGGNLRKLLFLGLTFTLAVSFGQQSTADQGGYKGPAVLNTSGFPTGRYVGEPMSFQWHVGATGSYATDITPAVTDENGQLIKESSAGALVRGGVSGVKHGKDSTFFGDLAAGYRYYSKEFANLNSGVDVSGGMGYSRQIDVRTAVQIAAQAYTTGYSWGGVYTPTVRVPIDGIGRPIDNGFDSRTSSLGASGGVTRMLTRRWAATASVSGYYTKRHSDSLISSNGFQATGSLNYLIDSSSSTGLGYSFANYRSPEGFGNTYAHSLYWQFSKSFENHWSISGYAGVFYSSYERAVAVPLDPVLAAIIGGGQTVLQPLSQTGWGPTIGVTASRGFKSSSISFYYRRGISPGTAFLASATSDDFGAHYSLTTSNRTNLGVGFSYSHHKAPGSDFTYDNYGGSCGFNYRIGGGFNFTANATYYRQSSTGDGLNRDRFYAGIGFTYGSGSRPVSLF
jgi:hypothetical protein